LQETFKVTPARAGVGHRLNRGQTEPNQTAAFLARELHGPNSKQAAPGLTRTQKVAFHSAVTFRVPPAPQIEV
jgi:hypothetical protein